jgi:hypothetical protein
MEEVLNVAWKRAPLRRVAKDVLARLAGELIVDSWEQYAAARGGLTYRVYFDEPEKDHFALRLHLEGGDTTTLAIYRREMESAILLRGGYVK